MTTASDNVRGIGYIVLAMLIFSLQNVAVKWMSGDYPILEIVVFRSVIALPATFLLYKLEKGRGLPRTPRLTLELTRGLILFFSYVTYFMGLAALTLADITAIRFSAPLMIAVLSVIFLREKVGPLRWMVLIAGFAGVLLIVKPGSISFNIGSLFILLSTLLYAVSIPITRRLSEVDSSATMAYFSTYAYIIAVLIFVPITILIGDIPDIHPSFAFLLHSWAMPTLTDWAIMSGLGIVWASGMVCIAKAYSLALASVAAPFEYIALPINIMWGFMIWREIPTLLTLLGAFLTLLSGLFLYYHERE